MRNMLRYSNNNYQISIEFLTPTFLFYQSKTHSAYIKLNKEKYFKVILKLFFS